MRRFLVLPLPAPGHVNPTLAVAAELVARGHAVSYLLPETFRGTVEATGARLVPLDGVTHGAPPVGQGNQAVIGMLMNRLITVTEQAEAPLRALVAAEPPDVLVVEPMSLWGRFLADATGIATAGYSPSYLTGRDGPVAERFAAAGRAAGGPPPGRMVDGLRALATRYGADPDRVGPLPFGPVPGETVVFMPRAFHPGGDAFGPDVHFVGPMLDRAEDTGFSLGAMERTPGVLVSLGTAFNDRPEFFRAAVEAVAGVDLPGVVATGRADVADLAAPESVVLAPHVPQLRALRHARVFVTHGGMNSTMEAAAHGVPLVVVPQMIEQSVTAGRVAELGMGIALDPEAADAGTLRAALAEVLADPSYRAAAQAMQAECAAAGGVGVAADVLQAARTDEVRAGRRP